MAAILKLRRGNSASPSLTDGELFLNYTLGALQYASGSTVFTLLPIDKSISGDIILNGDITASNMVLSGDISARNITLSGNIVIGDEIQDNIIVQGQFSGSLIPSASNEFDLGIETKKWRNLYSVSASFDNILLPGSGILSSSNTNFLDYTESIDGRLSNIELTTESLDGRLTAEETKSLTLQTVTASFDNRLDQLETDSGSQDGRLTNLELTSASHDSRITQLETDTGSQDNRLDNLELTSASHDNRLNQLETDSGSQDGRLTNLELTSESHDSRLNQLETDSGSQDGRLTNLELTSASHDSRLTNLELTSESLDITYEEKASGTHTLISGSSQVEINNVDGFTTYSSSVDSRLDSLELDTHTHSNKATLDVINQNLSTNSDVTFNSGSFTGNVTVTGDLVVLGNATEIQTSELRIEDKLITIASGSSNSAEADGAGIEIDGADVSIIWEANTNSFLLNAKVSSSVGFKGDGSELTDIDYNNIIFDGSGVVSGSDQVTQSLDLRYLQIDGDSVVSGSSQITYGEISQIPTNIVSSSSDTSTLSLSIQDGVISGGVIGGVISGSDQVSQSLDLRYLQIDGDDVVSGSSQITYGEISQIPTNIVSSSTDSTTVNFTITNGDITADLIGGVISGSDQVVESLPSGVVSGSDQVTQSLDLRYLQIDGDSVVSSSIVQTDFQGTFTASVNGVDTNIDLGLKQTDTPEFENIKLSDLPLLGNGELNTIISGSSGILGYRVLGTAAFLNVSNSIDNDQNVIPTNFAVNQALIDAGAGDITSINSSNLYPASTTGIEHNGAGTTDGSGYYGNVGDAVLTLATGSVHFLDGVKKKLDSDSVFSSSQQLYDILDSRYADELGHGVVSGSSQIDALGFLKVDGDGVISGSSQVQIDSVTGFTSFSSSVDIRIDLLESFSSSLDAEFVTEVELNTATQSLQDSIDTKLNTGSYNTDSQSFDSRLDSLEGVTSENPLTFTDTSTIDFTRVGDVITADVIGGVVSGSSQVIGILDSLNTYTSSNDTNQTTQNGRLTALEVETGSISTEQSIQDGRLNNLESYTASVDSLYEEKASGTHTLVSGSSQIDLASVTNNTTTNVSEGTNLYYTDLRVKTKLDVETVISGSSQLSSSFDSRYVNTTGDESISGNKTFNNNVVISGDLNVAGTTTYTSTNNVNIGDNILELNFGGSATTSGILTKDSTGGSTTSGSLLWDATNDYWKAGKFGSEAKILLSLGDGVVSGSAQITKTLQQVTTAGNTTSTSISITNSTASTSKTTGALIVTGGIGTSGDIFAGGDIVAYASSDRRLKDNILPIENSLQKINQIGGYSFDWNVEKQNIYSGKDYGVIAQEIEEILPELVETRENGYKAVKYDRLVSLLIEGIKELSKEVLELKNKVGE